VFHRDYSGATYRENLGLLRPSNPGRRPTARTENVSGAAAAARLG
jgi:hypothetical protein